MQYPGGYYPVEHPPTNNSSYAWASAPPYGETNSAHYPPVPDFVTPNHGSVPPNYGYNPSQTSPVQYANAFPQYSSANPSQFTPPTSVTPAPNYPYADPSAPLYYPYAAPNTGCDQPVSFSESRVYGNRDCFQNPGFQQTFYENPVGNEVGYNKKGFEVEESGFGGEVYAYDGDQTEPYGARGTSSKPRSAFDDYGNSSKVTGFDDYGNLSKITRAVPKAEAQDGGNGVQKFRVKILPDSGGQSPMDVLCQIGLDGLRMLDPSTTKTLRIYPLETITRWEVTEPSIYTFWAKSPVDIDPRRIRLQSNSYTTSTILDTVAAACVQLREMVVKDGLEDKSNGYRDANKTSDQPTERKRTPLADWVTLRRPAEEKEHWVPDEAVTKCTACGTDFGAFVRRHHCRNCGDIFCNKCTQGRVALTADEDAQPVRVCDRCLAEVTQRLANAKETSGKATAQRSHDDLAKRLLEEMGRNRKANSDSGRSSGSSPLWSNQSNSAGTGKRMREVACPTCTVHLQVQLPSSGTETVECGVCQHPFLVSAS